MRVLLVDDDEGLIALGEYMLRKLGHEYISATSGAQAEAAVKAQTPDIILLDIFMPDQDGFDTLAHLRTAGYRGPVVMISAIATAEKRAKEAGADFRPKPFSMKELATLLAQTEQEQAKGGKS